MLFLRSLSALALLAVPCVSLPNNLNSPASWSFLNTRSINNDPDVVDLRILPLGDSITWGHVGKDGNGYRWNLVNMILTLSGNSVQYIGSILSGNMQNSNNEGHSGAIITEIATYSERSLPQRPNVVLLMAGTNDIDKISNPEGAPARLGSLIDKITLACPDAAVLVAQITPNTDSSKVELVKTFNATIPGIVASRVKAGAHVLVVDMYTAVTTKDLADRLHPNDLGYSKIAKAWYDGLQQAVDKGWIKAPVATPGKGNSTSCPTFLAWDKKFGRIATGVGNGDAAFVSGWQSAGKLADGNVGPLVGDFVQTASVHLADMNGDGRDDYVWVHPISGAVTLYINGGYTASGGVNWISKGQVATSVAQNGDVTAYINGGEKSEGGWLWNPIGKIAGGTGATRLTTRFADIDGDGRADYLFVRPKGSLTAWFNSGHDDRPDWEPLGVSAGKIASGVGAPYWQIVFGDLNGDGKKDYVQVDPKTGALTVWLNTGTGGTYVAGDGIRFADMDGDGREDYLSVDPNGALTLYRNHGYNTASNCYWRGCPIADLDGDGRADYLWVDTDGSVKAFLNGGSGPNGGSIQFADTNGEGRADYLDVSPSSGAVTEWYNDCFGSGLANITNSVWQNAKCSDVGVTDEALDPSLRWDAVNATGAWIGAISHWRANPSNGGLSFIQQVSKFFESRPGMDCAVTVDRNGCDESIECDTANYPAGYMIINSLIQLSKLRTWLA
ncbi:hypothetical protein B0J14DRAFT_567201 [Halenospora varia]|nr:hypothetical protein B0J14DRAFT_567201 [Halenospora varia]